jgi:GTP cyclohydrolase I
MEKKSPTPMTDALAASYLDILKAIGEDPDREGLQKTPQRAACALATLTAGYRQNLDDLVNGAVFSSDDNNMVIVKDIELYSMCEHHMLPFFGRCHVGYIPTGKVIGLSKIPRIVDLFSRRFQIQEKLTRQIAETLMNTVNAEGVGVVIEARHLCMMMRGVEKQNSVMTTSCMLGSFRDESATRAEFLSLLNR